MTTNLDRARQLMLVADSNDFLDNAAEIERQITVLNALQSLAFQDPDDGGIPDIADWCLRSWLRVLAHHPADFRVLTALGQWWLGRSQPLLARVALNDNTSSSSGSHSSLTDPRSRSAPATDETGSDDIEREAEARMHLPDYVEARGFLVPATEYLRQAIEYATTERALTGELLVTAAEAYMSLGNVSYARMGEGIFERAVLYLRAASQISGYRLPRHLRRWLEDYGRFVP